MQLCATPETMSTLSLQHVEDDVGTPCAAEPTTPRSRKGAGEARRVGTLERYAGSSVSAFMCEPRSSPHRCTRRQVQPAPAAAWWEEARAPSARSGSARSHSAEPLRTRQPQASALELARAQYPPPAQGITIMHAAAGQTEAAQAAAVPHTVRHGEVVASAPSSSSTSRLLLELHNLAVAARLGNAARNAADHVFPQSSSGAEGRAREAAWRASRRTSIVAPMPVHALEESGTARDVLAHAKAAVVADSAHAHSVAAPLARGGADQGAHDAAAELGAAVLTAPQPRATSQPTSPRSRTCREHYSHQIKSVVFGVEAAAADAPRGRHTLRAAGSTGRSTSLDAHRTFDVHDVHACLSMRVAGRPSRLGDDADTLSMWQRAAHGVRTTWIVGNATAVTDQAAPFAVRSSSGRF
ncbi:hypothetical protein EON67_02690 [archaeon]|nr:MAG: hypothetical protein EON67_02690 [archaeon]